MPRTELENQKIRQATRSKIIDSAMTLFAQNGYAHTTVRMIAARAGISTGLMYHYYDSKEALLHAVFENCMTILNRAFTAAYEQASPDRRLENLLFVIFDILEQDQEFWALFYMMRTQPAVLTVLGDLLRQWTGLLRNLFVTELTNRGSLQAELDALILYSLIEGTIQQYLLDPDEYPLQAVAGQIINFFN